VSDKERAHQLESTEKEVATKIADMCINPATRRPYPVSTIEKGLHDVHFSIKPNRSAKQLVCVCPLCSSHKKSSFQALEVIPKLRETMEIERAKMRVRVTIPSNFAKACKEKVTQLIAQIEAEHFIQGDLDLVSYMLLCAFQHLFVMEILVIPVSLIHGMAFNLT
jgi:ribosome maturation protein SDO1